MTLTVAHRFRGPAGSGNGGYVAGRLAQHVDAVRPVTVTLRRPPPLETALEVVAGDDEVRLVHDATTIAEAVVGPDDLVAVPAVGADEAVAAGAAYGGRAKHPFPECFVCGTERAPGDGMLLTPGRLDDGRTACVWTVADDTAGRAEFVWAALDCPGGWAAPIEGRPMVLGRLTARMSAVATAGERCVVMGTVLGAEGRKTWTATTVYGAGGRELGRAHATWIAITD